jgi:hypothetical protein
MMKLLSTLGFFGFVLIGAFYLNAPGAAPVSAQEESSACRLVEVAIDEGYGISQTETRSICGTF